MVRKHPAWRQCFRAHAQKSGFRVPEPVSLVPARIAGCPVDGVMGSNNKVRVSSSKAAFA